MNRLMIVPAAGLGSRLGSSVPKVLCPVNGKPMIDYLFDLYSSVVEQFILVLHPSFAPEVVRYCETYPLPIEYEMQEKPTGMLDAILIPTERVRRYRPRSVWITWCDQIAVQPLTVSKLVTLSEQDSKAALIFPTVLRTEPYIHIARDDQGEIIDILHQREGDTLPEVGESDMGLFCLSGDTYLQLLTDFARDVVKGALTQERNFLSFIPWLQERAEVHTFPACHEMESVGINTPTDLDQVEKYLRHG
jgi:bifunctional UDP-N-acetylglucosamine pyrophosphorylase / glucosamine-1-phosphate N-acetyltransferase